MNALELLSKYIHKYKTQDRPVRAVIIDSGVARGFIYFVAYRGWVFALANDKDVSRALASLYMTDELAGEYVFGVSVLRGNNYVLEVSNGVYLCAYSVQ